MAISAADVRSALSIPEGNATAGPSQPKKHLPQNARKPDGISRELYSLIGPSAPSLAAQLAKPRLKQKPNFGGGTAKTRWELRPFKNGARQDNLELWHWEKVTSDPPTEYAFAKYNTQSTTYIYSQDEYTRFLDDKEWTKEETDYLFSVVQDYDSRWYIIYDRYDFPGGPTRSLEDLKDRYYSVCRKLVRNRPWAGDEASKAQLISSFQFDKEREMTRKKYIISLENRTPDQIAEEEALYIEVKRLEHNERKFKKERESLLRTLAGIDSGLPDIVEDDGTQMGISNEKTTTKGATTKKKGGQPTDVDSPATPSVASTPALKRPSTTKNAVYDATHCIIRTEPPTSGVATKAAHQPAYLRSFKLPTPKAAIAPKITQALAELGISHSRLVMPTRENTAQLEALLDATTALIETKRVMDKVEYDIQVLKNRLGMREASQAATDVEMKQENTGDAEGSNFGETGGENEDGEDGRAQSVMSARSARNRKHPRRSVSVSSVDTASTRAGVKRQKKN
ncbi:SWR1-complex protein 4 [Psilocybe cubensis]|uniref:SWR1-complex protein 4 n=2 Tax=Psilocybe cubensis TaxID=181762 RepID=A0ACB8H4D3_PSICU|nr:SWR1-complex protein 4 [Psilocybe cubensis]KAH9482579.1 SWR1-complex protein 4 [Psilocybe cubensis]